MRVHQVHWPPQDSPVLDPPGLRFFVGDQILPTNVSIENFQYTAQIFLILDNQKNATQGKISSHFRSDSPEA